jgi:3-isopropylmalate/(R)-2-methylmalate dehydratase small subunit
MTQLGNGRAWMFGAHITTDDILPGRYLDHGNDEVGRFAMAGIDPDFTRKVDAGDYIVAGSHFGTGSGRESAPYAIQGAGIAAVIAPSFARVFFRNAINIGLPAIVVESTAGIVPGDPLSVDLAARAVTNHRTRISYLIQNLTGISLDILRAGGIVPYTLRRTRTRAVEKPCP